MIVYKVVKKFCDGSFASAYVTQTGLQLRYQIGHTTRPLEGTSIFVFDSLVNAKCWRGSGPILECVTDTAEMTDSMTRMPEISFSTLDYILGWWKNLRGKGDGHSRVPIGTLLVPWVKPLRVAYNGY